MAIEAGETTYYQAKRGIVQDGLVLNLDAAVDASYNGGTTWRDLAGSNNGTLTNGPTFSSENGGVLSFDGTDDYVVISTAPTSLVTNNSPVTISVWVYPHVTGQHMILGNGNTSRFYVETFGSVFHWGFGGNNNNATSQATFSINNWYNYVASYDGANVRGYLNSILTDTTSISSPSYGGSELKIGNWQNNLYFDGNISNVSVYNRSLTSDEVARNYNATRHRFGV